MNYREHAMQTVRQHTLSDPKETKLLDVRRERLVVVAVALMACVIAYAVEAHLGFDLGDESYLWYGVQRVLHGEIPVRDFMSYDIGRYYWCGAVAVLLGSDGILCVRAAALAFGAVGLTCSIWTLHFNNEKRIWWLTLAMSCILTLWMIPRHKLFDISTSLILVAALGNLLAKKTPRSFFVHGLLAGLAAVIGRNHGAYGVLSFFLALPLLLRATTPVNWPRSLPAWAAGVFSGYLPVIAMCLTASGFVDGIFRDACLNLFAYNPIPVPVPWPWSVLTATPFNWQALAIGCFFMLLLCFDLIGLAAVYARAWARQPVNPLLASAVLVSIGYTHHAFSRADIGHLAQGIFPCLVGLSVCLQLARIKSSLKIAAVFPLLTFSLLATLPAHPAFAAIHHHWVPMQIGTDTLRIEAGKANLLKAILAEIDEVAPDGNFLSVPFWPGLYAMVGSRSPIFDIYALFKRSDIWQLAEIEQLKRGNPHLAFVVNAPFDKHESMRFSKNNVLLYSYIRQHFQQINFPVGQDLDLMVFQNSGATGSTAALTRRNQQPAGNTIDRNLR